MLNIKKKVKKIQNFGLIEDLKVLLTCHYDDNVHSKTLFNHHFS